MAIVKSYHVGTNERSFFFVEPINDKERAKRKVQAILGLTRLFSNTGDHPEILLNRQRFSSDSPAKRRR